MNLDPVVTVRCESDHVLYWFRCKNGPNKGKIFWKSNHCKSFYSNQYIKLLSPYGYEESTPYEDFDIIVTCMGQ